MTGVCGGTCATIGATDTTAGATAGTAATTEGTAGTAGTAGAAGTSVFGGPGPVNHAAQRSVTLLLQQSH